MCIHGARTETCARPETSAKPSGGDGRGKHDRLRELANEAQAYKNHYPKARLIAVTHEMDLQRLQRLVHAQPPPGLKCKVCATEPRAEYIFDQVCHVSLWGLQVIHNVLPTWNRLTDLSTLLSEGFDGTTAARQPPPIPMEHILHNSKMKIQGILEQLPLDPVLIGVRTDLKSILRQLTIMGGPAGRILEHPDRLDAFTGQMKQVVTARRDDDQVPGLNPDSHPAIVG